MHATALIETSDGRVHELVHGDVIGRLWSAALQLDDARVSEAHALVSLRGSDLKLLALRGVFAVGGRPTKEAVLEQDLGIELAPGVRLRVLEVRLPTEVLGIEGPDVPRRVLPSVCSVSGDSPPRLQAKWVAGAAAQVWSTGNEWRVRQGDGPARPVQPGDVLEVPGGPLRIVAIPLESAGAEATRVQGPLHTPLRIEANYDTVHIHRRGEEAVVIGGVQARIVSELVTLNGPVAWTVLADLVWPRETERALLRTRLDVHLSRLRRKLRAARIRPDVVRSDGAGSIGLLLYEHDEVVDRT